MGTAVFFHAHPDDESIFTGGTMARLSAEGHRVVLVTATRGELGEYPEGFLAPQETIGERRSRELARACLALGVSRHEWLGYRDSGMAGQPTNWEPDSFCMADVDEAARRLVRIVQSESADVLVAYDERGVYGHPDHVQVHRVGLRAAQLSGVPAFFMATVDNDRFGELRALGRELGLNDSVDPSDVELGVPANRITTAVDVRPWCAQKRTAIGAHESQIGQASFFSSLSPEDFELIFGTEWFIRYGASPSELREDHLFLQSR